MIAGFLFGFLAPAPVPMRVVATGLGVVGFGAVVTTPAAAGLVLASVDSARAAVASAMFNTFRQVGGAVGVTVLAVAAAFLPSLETALRVLFAVSAALPVPVPVHELLCWHGR